MLGKVGGPPAVEIVADLLDMPDQAIRLGGVRILSKIGADSGAVPLIERALQDRDMPVARAATTELKQVCTNISRVAIDRLIDGFGWLQNWELALEVASEVRTTAMYESLVLHLEDSRPLVAAGSAWVVGHLGQPELAERLVPLTAQANRLIQLNALHGLCLLGRGNYNHHRRRLLNSLDLELYMPAEIDRYLLVFRECLILSDRPTLLATTKALCNTEDERAISLMEPVLERLDNQTLEAVIRFAGLVGSPQAQALLERLSTWSNQYISNLATRELEKTRKPSALGRISSHSPRAGIIPSARPDQPDHIKQDMEKARIPDTVLTPDFLLDHIDANETDEQITAAVLGLTLLGQPSEIQVAYECLFGQSAKRKRSKGIKSLLAILEFLQSGSDDIASRLRFARLLAACSPVYYDGWGDEIALRSKQNCVAAGALYAKRYGREQFFADLSALLQKPDESAQVKAFAAFSLAAWVGRPATVAICSGLQAVDRHLQRVPEAAIGIKWLPNTTLVIRACAEALEGLQDSTAVPALLQAIWRNESSGDTLLAILEALQIIGDPAAIPALARVARYETSTWGNPDEGGGSVAQIAGDCVRRLRRKLVQSQTENTREVYEQLLDSETQLEQRYEQLSHPSSGAWLARKLTAFSMRIARPRHRYFLIKGVSERHDPRKSVWQWLKWELLSWLQFVNNFWFVFAVGGFIVMLLLSLAIVLLLSLWWLVFAEWLGSGLIGWVTGTDVGRWIGVIMGGLTTYAAYKVISTWVRSRQESDNSPRANYWVTRQETQAIYDWILERLEQKGISLECTL